MIFLQCKRLIRFWSRAFVSDSVGSCVINAVLLEVSHLTRSHKSPYTDDNVPLCLSPPFSCTSLWFDVLSGKRECHWHHQFLNDRTLQWCWEMRSRSSSILWNEGYTHICQFFSRFPFYSLLHSSLLLYSFCDAARQLQINCSQRELKMSATCRKH